MNSTEIETASQQRQGYEAGYFPRWDAGEVAARERQANAEDYGRRDDGNRCGLGLRLFRGLLNLMRFLVHGQSRPFGCCTENIGGNR